MPTSDKSTHPKKNTTKKNASDESYFSRAQSGWRVGLVAFLAISRWLQVRQSASPHRSFTRTRRRDYERTLELPGYTKFSVEVWRMLWLYRSTFGLLILAYSLMSGLLVGTASQSTYTQLAGAIRTNSGDVAQGNLGQLGEAGILLVTGLSGGLNPAVSETQQLLAGLLVLMAWLTTVWLLRAYLAGQRPRVRDGLYNAGAPIVPTMLVGLLLVVQLIPAALVAVGVAAAVSTGLLNGGVEAMLFWTVAFLLILLSLYWITSTLIALVIVTLPGMYPMQALKTASELVVGRRFQILLRILWLLVASILVFALIMIPVILVDAWLKAVLPSIHWLPIVPFGLLVMSATTTVWSASYIYLFYRRIVDNDAE